MARRPIVPITREMLMPAAGDAVLKPRYHGVEALEDWHGGSYGNDADEAEALQAIANRHSDQVEPDYEPQHQEQKGEMMHVPMPVLADIGLDYGAHAGQTGRTGAIGPLDPYPTAETPPEVP